MPKQKGVSRSHSFGKIKPDGINHLLVIAIDEYRYARRLTNCVRDANDLIEVLTKKYRFNPEQVETICNANATRDNILETLYRYRNKVKGNDNLLIYFSGHGELDGADGFWVPVDAILRSNLVAIQHKRPFHCK